ncbi:MAG: GntR family transcriptional regulator [Granulosicoccus sp.]
MASSSIIENDIPERSVRRLKRRSLAQHIADELRDLVLLEKLAPGAPIPERETALALGVSRTPLRESLRILASEGLVEIAPNRPPQVANPSLEELRELLQVQGSLEALAGELACQNAGEDELLAIVELESEMRLLTDKCEPLEFFQKDMQFHARIVLASGNTALIETHKTYNARLWRARFISSRRRVNRNGTLEQHGEIADALRDRHPVRAARALRRHLDCGFRNIRTALTESEQTDAGTKP